MFEHRSLPLLSRGRFFLRLALMTLVGAIGLAISLGISIAGYHYFEGLSAIDSFANAAMILSGMGPLNQLSTDRERSSLESTLSLVG